MDNPIPGHSPAVNSQAKRIQEMAHDRVVRLRENAKKVALAKRAQEQSKIKRIKELDQRSSMGKPQGT